jgi:hypothetical protein
MFGHSRENGNPVFKQLLILDTRFRGQDSFFRDHQCFAFIGVRFVFSIFVRLILKTAVGTTDKHR